MVKGSDGMESRWTLLDDVRMHVDGLRIHARVSTNEPHGETVPVVLVHGLGVSSAYWLPTAALLSKYFRVFAPDLPGFGDSGKPGHILDLRELADVLAVWMDAMGIDRAALVGNSMGCQIAAKSAIAHPDRVTRLVLQGPTINPKARSAYQQIGRLMIDGLVEPPSLLPVVMRDYFKCGYRRIAGTLRHHLDDPIEEILPLIHVPALVVRGSRDPIVPQRWAEDAAQLLPLGRLVVIPRGSHAANYARPQELAGIIRAFLTEEDRDKA